MLFLLTLLFLLCTQKTYNFSLVWDMLIKIHGRFMYNAFDSD